MQPGSDVATNRTLVRVQAISGVLFALFLFLHLCNQMLAAFGPDAYNGAQRTLRRAYQSPPIELAMVLIPMVVHAAAGVLRIARRRRQKNPAHAPANLYTRLHRISGIILLIFFAGHVTATRGASLLYDRFPEFSGVAFTLRWVPAYFWPYYTTFALAGLYHLIHGLGVALPVLGLRFGTGLRRPLFLVPACTLLGFGIVLGMLGFGGILVDVGQPEQSPYAQLVLRLTRLGR